MCGIGGFSLSNNSKINPRKLSNALLTELDIRGNQASGYAFQTADSQGYFKKDTAGSKLNLKGMPKDSRIGILHTRYATHGSTKNMANNHPVQSPDGSISLVHNGVIYNHDLVRTEIDPKNKLPEVDSSVVPAILQKFNRDTSKFDMLDGDASVAWLDEKDMGTLWVARISHSPLYICQTTDGSFIFASTESILEQALERAGIDVAYQAKVIERTLLGIRNGRIDIVEALPETNDKYIDYGWYNKSYLRQQTAGGYGTLTSWEEDLYEWDLTRQYETREGGDYEPKLVKFQSAWGDIEGYDNDPDVEGRYPNLPNTYHNAFGEYFDRDGAYWGTYGDLLEQGLVDPSYISPDYRKKQEMYDQLF